MSAHDPTGPGGATGPLRLLWLLLGCLCVLLGIIGAFLPLMPTTIFIIMAAGCFARSSPRLESWLLGHPRFGPSLVAWRRERAIGRGAKRAACAGMALGYAIFWLSVRPGWPLALLVACCLMACAVWIVTRPLPTRPC